MPSISSCFVFGLISLLINSLSSCHMFSMGLQSGLSGGVFHQLTPFVCIHAAAYRDVCLGSLSCMNRWWFGYTELIKGMRVASRIDVYSCAFIIPSKMQIPVLPLELIPAQTCTFVGCLGLYRET